MSRTAIIVLAAAVMAADPASAAVEPARLDAIFADWNAPDRPGCVVTATRDGQVLATRAFGQGIVETATPNTTGTEFHLASVSKSFTGFAIRLLEAEGRLSVDDDVRKYVPELHDFGHPITLSNLLHHTSGLRDQWELLTMQGRKHGDAFSQDDVLRVLMAQRELNFQPGERFSYSNSNYTLLALVVERVAGKPFPDFMAERVFAPLGMTNSYVNADMRPLRPSQAGAYWSGEGGVERRQLAYSNYGATDVRASAGDMARWIINFDRPTVGSAAIIAAMGEGASDAHDRPVHYASGLIRGEYRGEPMLEHSGVDPGYVAQMLMLPGKHFGVAVMCNSETAPSGELARAVVDLYLGDELGLKPASLPTVTLPDDTLRARAGLYMDEDGMPFALEYRDGRLFAQGQDELRATGPVTLASTSGPVSFSFSANGAMTLHEPDRDKPMRRVTGHRPPPALMPEGMQAYVGGYYSPELGVTMKVEVRDGQMRLSAPGLEAPIFQPPGFMREEDAFFSPSPMGWLRFRRRGAGGEIVEVAASNGRVVNLRFLRIDPPAL